MMIPVLMAKATNNYPMKLSSVIIALLFSFCISCQAQQSKPAVKIINGPNFTANATLNYHVSGSAGYYYIGLEKQLDGQWREIVLDISTGVPERGAIVRKLIADKTVAGAYQLKRIPAIYRQNGHAYRLKITSGPVPDAMTMVAASGEFSVK